GDACAASHRCGFDVSARSDTQGDFRRAGASISRHHGDLRESRLDSTANRGLALAGGAIMKKRKTMTALANEYLRHRRKLGYQLHISGKMLLNFTRWADRIGHRGPLTVALAVRWARLPK